MADCICLRAHRFCEQLVSGLPRMARRIIRPGVSGEYGGDPLPTTAGVDAAGYRYGASRHGMAAGSGTAGLSGYDARTLGVHVLHG